MTKYVNRILELELIQAAREFPAIMLTGPRQTGKSTMLQKIFPRHRYFTFDDPLTRKLAHEDPKHFLSQSTKMIIDEIQYLPDLIPYIKLAIDKLRNHSGRFILTGSQIFPLMAGVSESLAGRVALYELLGFSTEEVNSLASLDITDCFFNIFNGFFPSIVAQHVAAKRFYSSYVQTYLERDIRQITSVQDLKIFQNFLELLAARVGCLLNLNEISKECGVSFTTARRWLSLLEASRLVFLLRPYAKNISKRVVKSPKIYFTDTGLLVYLLKYPDHQTLMAGPQNSALFENLVVLELLKYKLNHNKNYELYFYRDSNDVEVDVVLDYGRTLKLLEIKLTATPQDRHFTALRKVINLFSVKTFGYLLTFAPEEINYSTNVSAIPWLKIFQTL